MRRVFLLPLVLGRRINKFRRTIKGLTMYIVDIYLYVVSPIFYPSSTELDY